MSAFIPRPRQGERLVIDRVPAAFDPGDHPDQWCVFERDWRRREPCAAAGFVLARDESRLRFAARCAQSPDCDRSLANGAWAENLWRRDAAELFLKNRGSPRYLEFNLSPSGA